MVFFFWKLIREIGLMFLSKDEEALCIYILLHDVLINVLSMLLLHTHTLEKSTCIMYLCWATLSLLVLCRTSLSTCCYQSVFMASHAMCNMDDEVAIKKKKEGKEQQEYFLPFKSSVQCRR